MSKTYKYGFILTGDSKMAVKSLKDVEIQTGRFNKELSMSEKWLRRIGAINIAQLVAPMARSVVNTAKATIDFADNVQKLSQRIGVSTKALSEYQYVADLTGVSFNTLTMGLQRQTRRISEAAQGTGEAVKALNELGLSAKSLNKLAPEEQFEVLADALNGVSNQSDKVRLAMKLWDSEGVAMLQTVKGGSEALKAMRGEAQALGKTISQDTADAMAGLNDSFTRLHAATSGTTTRLLAELSPAIIDFNQMLIDNMDTIGNVTKAFLSMREPIIYVFDGVSMLTSAMMDYWPVTTSVTAAMVAYKVATYEAAAANTAFGASFSKTKKGFMLFGSFLAGWSIGTWLREEFEEVRVAGIYMIDSLLKAGNYLKSGFEIVWAGIRYPFDLLITYLQKKMSEMVGDFASLLEALPDSFVPDGWIESLNKFSVSFAPAESATERLVKTVNKSKSELEKKNKAITAITNDMIEYELTTKKVQKQQEKTNKTTKDSGKTIKTTSESVKTLKESFENLTPAIEKYEELMLGITREKRQLEEDLWNAEELFQQGIITSMAELERYKKKLTETYNQSQNSAKTHVKTVKDEIPQAYKNAASSIQSSFSDLFYDIFNGGKNSFEDFTQTIKDVFKRMLAEMATMAIARPIIVPVMSTVGGMFGMSQNAVAGVTGQLGGTAGGGFSLGNISTFLQSGSLAGQMSGAINYGTSILGLGSYTSVPTQYGSLVGVGGAPISNTGLVMGGSNLALGASGLLGGYFASQLFDGQYSGMLGGIGSTLGYSLGAGAAAGGGLLGSSLGSLGAFAGPVGAIAGTILGGALGSLFGGGDSDTTPDLNLSVSKVKTQQRNSGQYVVASGSNAYAGYKGQFGNIYYSTQHDAFSSKQESDAFIKSVSDRYAALENILTQSFGSSQSDKIADNMKNFSQIYKFEESEQWEDGIATGIKRIFDNVVRSIDDVTQQEYSKIYESVYQSTNNLTASLASVSALKTISDSDTERSFENITSVIEKFATASSNLEQQLKDLESIAALLSLESVNSDIKQFLSSFDLLETDLTATEIAKLADNLISLNKVLPKINQETFDLSLSGARLAESLIEISGGMDAFVQKTNFYYDNFYSETEKAVTSFEMAYDAVENFNTAMSTSIFSKDKLKETIESLDLTTQSGQKLYSQLLDLAPALEQLDSATRKITDQAIQSAEKMLEAVQKLRTSVNNDILNIKRKQPGWNESEYQDQVIKDLYLKIGQFDSLDDLQYLDQIRQAINAKYDAEISALQQAQAEVDSFYSSLANIGNFLNSLQLSDVSPLTNIERLNEAGNQFFSTLNAARGGDAQAVSKLTDISKTYLDEARAYYSSSEQYQAIWDTVNSSLKSLVDGDVATTTYEQRKEQIDNEILKIQETQLSALKSLDKEIVSLQSTLNSQIFESTEKIWSKLDSDTKDLINALKEKSTAAIGSSESINSSLNTVSAFATSLNESNYSAISPYTGIERNGYVKTVNGKKVLETGFGPLIPLDENFLPKYADGTNYVSNDGIAFLHQGEAIVPKEKNPAYKDQDSELKAELIMLRQQVAELTQIIADSSEKTIDYAAIQTRETKRIADNTEQSINTMAVA